MDQAGPCRGKEVVSQNVGDGLRSRDGGILDVDVLGLAGKRSRQIGSELTSEFYGAPFARFGPVCHSAVIEVPIEILPADAEHQVLIEEVGIGPAREIPA